MLRRLIIDKERDLEIENDLLGTKCYANQLSDIIQNTSAEQAYTIGLYGRWGSGKSTIIKTAKHKLETENPQRMLHLFVLQSRLRQWLLQKVRRGRTN